MKRHSFLCIGIETTKKERKRKKKKSTYFFLGGIFGWKMKLELGEGKNSKVGKKCDEKGG